MNKTNMRRYSVEGCI
jgi:hypothetical protein